MKKSIISTTTFAAVALAASFTFTASTASAHTTCLNKRIPSGRIITVCTSYNHYHRAVKAAQSFGQTSRRASSGANNAIKGLGAGLRGVAGKQ